jgi:hypothetical protein
VNQDEAIHVGEHDVLQNQIRRALHQLESAAAIGSFENGVAAFLQREPYELARRGIVFDD